MDEYVNGPRYGQNPTPAISMTAGPDSDNDLDVWKLLGVVHRRFKLFGIVVAAIIAIAVVLVSGITPRYSSEAQILIENGESTFARPQGATPTTLAADQAAVLSEVQVLLSRDLAAEVSVTLGLADIDEFSGQGRKKPLFKRILSMVGFGGKIILPTDERVIDTYFERLSVQQIETARVVSIRFSAEDAELSANVANTLADVYIDATRRAKYSSDKDAAKWLKSEIDVLRGKVAEAEQAVERFRAGKGLLQSGRDISLNQQQLGGISTQLITARAQATEARTRAALVSGLIKKPGGLDAAAEVLNSRLIQRLRELQASQSRNFAELSAALLPGHPRMRQLRAEQADIEKRIRSEIKKIARGLENEADIADARVKEMEKSLNEFKIEATDAKSAEVKLRALERESKAQRDLLESFLSRYREASARGNLDSQPANARIISRATVAFTPSYPAKGSILALSLVAAVLFALVIAFLVEFLSPSSARARPMVSPDMPSSQSEMQTGRQVVGDNEALPSLADNLRDRPLTGENEGAVAEPVLGSGVALGFGAGDPHPLTGPSDAATMREVTRNIARMIAARNNHSITVLDLANAKRGTEIIAQITRFLAQAGHKAILVEAGQSRHLADIERLGSGPGLAELLNGSAALGEVLTRRPQIGLGLIQGGVAAMPKSAVPERMVQIIEALEARCDVVIVLAGAPSEDTLRLAAASDLTLLTVAPEAVSKPGFKSSIQALASAGVEEAVVITAGPQGVAHYQAITAAGDMPHVA